MALCINIKLGRQWTVKSGNQKLHTAEDQVWLNSGQIPSNPARIFFSSIYNTLLFWMKSQKLWQKFKLLHRIADLQDVFVSVCQCLARRDYAMKLLRISSRGTGFVGRVSLQVLQICLKALYVKEGCCLFFVISIIKQFGLFRCPGYWIRLSQVR